MAAHPECGGHAAADSPRDGHAVATPRHGLGYPSGGLAPRPRLRGGGRAAAPRVPPPTPAVGPTSPVRGTMPIPPGPPPNEGRRKRGGGFYWPATLEAATWGAELYDHLARLRELGIEAIED